MEEPALNRMPQSCFRPLPFKLFGSFCSAEESTHHLAPSAFGSTQYGDPTSRVVKSLGKFGVQASGDLLGVGRKFQS